jgi:hypothetical protein
MLQGGVSTQKEENEVVAATHFFFVAVPHYLVLLLHPETSLVQDIPTVSRGPSRLAIIKAHS